MINTLYRVLKEIVYYSNFKKWESIISKMFAILFFLSTHTDNLHFFLAMRKFVTNIFENKKKLSYMDETEFRAFFLSPLLSLSFFFSPSKKKRHIIKRETTLMATENKRSSASLYTCTNMQSIKKNIYF